MKIKSFVKVLLSALAVFSISPMSLNTEAAQVSDETSLRQYLETSDEAEAQFVSDTNSVNIGTSSVINAIHNGVFTSSKNVTLSGNAINLGNNGLSLGSDTGEHVSYDINNTLSFSGSTLSIGSSDATLNSITGQVILSITNNAAVKLNNVSEVLNSIAVSDGSSLSFLNAFADKTTIGDIALSNNSNLTFKAPSTNTTVNTGNIQASNGSKIELNGQNVDSSGFVQVNSSEIAGGNASITTNANYTQSGTANVHDISSLDAGGYIIVDGGSLQADEITFANVDKGAYLYLNDGSVNTKNIKSDNNISMTGGTLSVSNDVNVNSYRQESTTKNSTATIGDLTAKGSVEVVSNGSNAKLTTDTITADSYAQTGSVVTVNDKLTTNAFTLTGTAVDGTTNFTADTVVVNDKGSVAGLYSQTGGSAKINNLTASKVNINGANTSLVATDITSNGVGVQNASLTADNVTVSGSDGFYQEGTNANTVINKKLTSTNQDININAGTITFADGAIVELGTDRIFKNNGATVLGGAIINGSYNQVGGTSVLSKIQNGAVLLGSTESNVVSGSLTVDSITNATYFRQFSFSDTIVNETIKSVGNIQIFGGNLTAEGLEAGTSYEQTIYSTSYQPQTVTIGDGGLKTGTYISIQYGDLISSGDITPNGVDTNNNTAYNQTTTGTVTLKNGASIKAGSNNVGFYNTTLDLSDGASQIVAKDMTVNNATIKNGENATVDLTGSYLQSGINSNVVLNTITTNGNDFTLQDNAGSLTLENLGTKTNTIANYSQATGDIVSIKNLYSTGNVVITNGQFSSDGTVDLSQGTGYFLVSGGEVSVNDIITSTIIAKNGENYSTFRLQSGKISIADNLTTGTASVSGGELDAANATLNVVNYYQTVGNVVANVKDIVASGDVDISQGSLTVETIKASNSAKTANFVLSGGVLTAKEIIADNISATAGTLNMSLYTDSLMQATNSISLSNISAAFKNIKFNTTSDTGKLVISSGSTGTLEYIFSGANNYIGLYPDDDGEYTNGIYQVEINDAAALKLGNDSVLNMYAGGGGISFNSNKYINLSNSSVLNLNPKKGNIIFSNSSYIDNSGIINILSDNSVGTVTLNNVNRVSGTTDSVPTGDNVGKINVNANLVLNNGAKVFAEKYSQTNPSNVISSSLTMGDSSILMADNISIGDTKNHIAVSMNNSYLSAVNSGSVLLTQVNLAVKGTNNKIYTIANGSKSILGVLNTNGGDIQLIDSNISLDKDTNLEIIADEAHKLIISGSDTQINIADNSNLYLNTNSNGDDFGSTEISNAVINIGSVGNTKSSSLTIGDNTTIKDSSITALDEDAGNKITFNGNTNVSNTALNLKSSSLTLDSSDGNISIDSNSSISSKGQIIVQDSNVQNEVTINAPIDASAGSLSKTGMSTLNINGLSYLNSVTIGKVTTVGNVTTYENGGTVNINQNLYTNNLTAIGRNIDINVAKAVFVGSTDSKTTSTINIASAAGNIPSVSLEEGSTLSATNIILDAIVSSTGSTINALDTFTIGENASIQLISGKTNISAKNYVDNGGTYTVNSGASLTFDIEKDFNSTSHWDVAGQISFAPNSSFYGVEDGYFGGVFSNTGTILIGSNTKIGLADTTTEDRSNNAVRGAGLYNDNEGIFGAISLGSSVNNVQFTNNKAAESGGAIFNLGVVTLGTNTKFIDNSAYYGASIYNAAKDYIYSGTTRAAIIIGEDSYFTSNAAGNGTAVYTIAGTVSLGKRAYIYDNDSGLTDEEGSDGVVAHPDLFYFSTGAISLGGRVLNTDSSTNDPLKIESASGAVVDLGAHSLLSTNYSSYIGGAVANFGGVLRLHDDGLIDNTATISDYAGKYSVGFYGNGSQDINATKETYYTKQGGAIFNNGKIETVKSDGTTVSGLYNANFVANTAINGGAIYNYNDTDALSISNSNFEKNQAVYGVDIILTEDGTKTYKYGSGGAIYNASKYFFYHLSNGLSQKYPNEYETENIISSIMNISGTKFTGNTAAYQGGAIYNDETSIINISDDTEFNLNSATVGGAIYNTANAVITTKVAGTGLNKTINFVGNSATRQTYSPADVAFQGGAIYNAGTIKGTDSISTYSSTASTYKNEITDMYFESNYAGDSSDLTKDENIGQGGAIYNASGDTYISSTSFTNNYTYGEKSQGGAIYNAVGSLIIDEETYFNGNGGILTATYTGQGGAIYNAVGATVLISSEDVGFNNNKVTGQGGAIYNAGTTTISSDISIGSMNGTVANGNQAKEGGAIYNAGTLNLNGGVQFIGNTATDGAAIYMAKGSTVTSNNQKEADTISEISFTSNTATDKGAGVYLEDGVSVKVDNSEFVSNTANSGSAIYNAGTLTLGLNNTFKNNIGALIGNEGTLNVTEGYVFDGKTNIGNTALFANEKTGVINLTTKDGSALSVTAIGNGSANGAALSLTDTSTVNTDGVADTLANAKLSSNKGNLGGAIYKTSTNTLTLKNIDFDSNTANNGGALYNDNGTITIDSDVEFLGNSATNGGAIYNAADGIINFAAGYMGFAPSTSGYQNVATGNGGSIANYGVINLTTDANTNKSIVFTYQGTTTSNSNGNGGALYLGEGSNIVTDGKNNTLSNALFEQNISTNGGAIYNTSDITIEGTQFTENRADSNGGAIYNTGNLNIVLDKNNTFVNNQAGAGGGAIYNEGGTVVVSSENANEGAVISGNTAANGGAIYSNGGTISVNGGVTFQGNTATSGGGAIALAGGSSLILDTTLADIKFVNNKAANAASGSAISVQNGKIIFKGDDATSNKIVFTSDQTISGATSTALNNIIDVQGGTVNFESDLSNFHGIYTQEGGTVTLSNKFVDLKSNTNNLTGGTLILDQGAELLSGTSALKVSNQTLADTATIQFNNNTNASLTDLSALYSGTNSSGSTFMYTATDGNVGYISLSSANVNLNLTQDMITTTDPDTGANITKNSGEYALKLDGGALKDTVAIGNGNAVRSLTLSDAILVDTNVSVDGTASTSASKSILTLNGAGLTENVKEISLLGNALLNINNNSSETEDGNGNITSYNTDLTFRGKLTSDGGVTDGVLTQSAAQIVKSGTATLTFADGADASGYYGSYTQSDGLLLFESGATYFNSAISNDTNNYITYTGNSSLELQEGVLFTGDTVINLGDTKGTFVNDNGVKIDLSAPDKSIVYNATTKDGDTVSVTVNLGQDTVVQLTNSDTVVNASGSTEDPVIIGNAGEGNDSFNSVIVGGNEKTDDDKIDIIVDTEAIEGKDTSFIVKEDSVLGLGNVEFKDTTNADVSETYTPTIQLEDNSQLLLVSNVDSVINNLVLESIGPEKTVSIIKTNKGTTTLKNADLSEYTGAIILKDGEVAIDGVVGTSNYFDADQVEIDLTQLTNGAVARLSNITNKDDMTIGLIANEILEDSTGDESFSLTLNNDRGNIDLTKAVDLKNGSSLNVTAKNDLTLAEEGVDNVLTVNNGQINLAATEGTLTVKGNTELTSLTDESSLKGANVKVDALNIHDNTYLTTIAATDGNVETGDVSIKNATATILSSSGTDLTQGDIKTTGNITVDSGSTLSQITENGNIQNSGNTNVLGNSKYTAVSKGDITIGTDSKNELNVKDSSIQLVADKDVTLNSTTMLDNVSEDVYIQSKEGNISSNDVTAQNNKNTTNILAKLGINLGKLTLNKNQKTDETGVTTNVLTTVQSTNGDIKTEAVTLADADLAVVTADGSSELGSLSLKTDASNSTTAPVTTATVKSAKDATIGAVSVDKSYLDVSAANNITTGAVTVINSSKSKKEENGTVTFAPAVTLKSTEKGDISIESLGIADTATATVDDETISLAPSYVDISNVNGDVIIKNTLSSSSLTTDTDNPNAIINITSGKTDTEGNIVSTGNIAIGTNSLTGKALDLIANTTATLASTGDVAIGSKGISSTVSGNSILNVLATGENSKISTGNISVNDSQMNALSNDKVNVDGTLTVKNTTSNIVGVAVSSIKPYDDDDAESGETPSKTVNDIITALQNTRDNASYKTNIIAKDVNITDGLTTDNANISIGTTSDSSSVKTENVNLGSKVNLDDTVVTIDASGNVVAGDISANDAIVTVSSNAVSSNSLTVNSTNKDYMSYVDLNGVKTFNNAEDMNLNYTVLNAKDLTTATVGGTGTLYNSFLNVPNANLSFNQLSTTGSEINLKNNSATNVITVAGDYNVSGGNLYYMDFDPANNAYDKVSVGGKITGSDDAAITVNSTLLSKQDIGTSSQLYKVFDTKGGSSDVQYDITGDTSYSTDFATYQLSSLNNGQYVLARTSYNPAAKADSVAAQVGGFLTQVQTYDTAFENIDMVMMLPRTAYDQNRYAVTDSDDTLIYSPVFIPELEKGIWFRPFGNFEKFSAGGGVGTVTAQQYGALVGGDTPLKDFGNGVQGSLGAYVGYTGAHETFDGVSGYQNGGVIGVTGAVYKNGFFSALTVSANASGSNASSNISSNDFFMLAVGAASKTGYNWEIANGKFIIQPSWLMSYTFVNAFSPSNIAGFNVDTDALHAVQLVPGLKLMANLPNGWQPYLTVDYRFNLGDDAHFKVAGTTLPNANVNSYIEYGLGMQKRWGDRFTGFGQFLGRGIGRNGVGLNLGMRWMVGQGR